MQPLQCWAESALPGGDRVKVSENLGATSVAPVAPVDTSLHLFLFLSSLKCQTYPSLIHIKGSETYDSVLTNYKYLFRSFVHFLISCFDLAIFAGSDLSQLTF